MPPQAAHSFRSRAGADELRPTEPVLEWAPARAASGFGMLVPGLVTEGLQVLGRPAPLYPSSSPEGTSFARCAARPAPSRAERLETRGRAGPAPVTQCLNVPRDFDEVRRCLQGVDAQCQPRHAQARDSDRQ